MTQEDIELALKLVAMGRTNHPTVLEFAGALAKVLASPEERLAMAVQDAMPKSAVLVQVVAPDQAPPLAEDAKRPVKKAK